MPLFLAVALPETQGGLAESFGDRGDKGFVQLETGIKHPLVLQCFQNRMGYELWLGPVVRFFWAS